MQGKHMLSRTLDSLRKALSIHALSSALFTKLPLSLSYMYSILTCMCSPLITKPLESAFSEICFQLDSSRPINSTWVAHLQENPLCESGLLLPTTYWKPRLFYPHSPHPCNQHQTFVHFTGAT